MSYLPPVYRRFLISTFLLASVGFVAGCGSGSTPVVPPPPPPTPPPVSSVAGYTLSPASLSFGTVALGSASASQVVTVTSTGMLPLIFSDGAITGDFSSTAGTCQLSPVSLATGASCTLSLQFAPFLPGTRTGALVLTTNAPIAAATVPLTGTGGTVSDTVSTTSLNFGAQQVNTISASQAVTITATGATPLYLSALTLSGDFARPSTTCTAVVAVGSSCVVNVTFSPTTAAARSGSLTIGSNGTTATQVVTLTGTGTTPPSVAGVPVTVKAMAGTTPILGASVQIYAAGAAGARTGSNALLATSVVTDATGSATLSGYTCPSAATPVYVLASGGASNLVPNPNSLLMTAIGPCGSIASGSTFVVSEATSVAAVYALQQFYGPAGVIGASATNLVGITNAFGTAAQLIDPTTGAQRSSLPATVGSPAARINSLADLVNTCVANAAGCSAFYAATSPGGTQPANVLDALYKLAAAPAANVAAVYAQSQKSTVYSPALATTPSDWTIYLNFTGGGLNSPSGIGVDSTGSIWVANYFYTASKFTSQGVPVFANGLSGVGLNNSYGLAIDPNDDVWVPNEQPYTNYGVGSVSVLTSGGGDITGGAGFQQGGLNYPLSVAIDPNATTWVVDYGNSHLTLLNSLGTPISGNVGYTTPLFAFPVAVAVDANHFGWIANQSSNTVTKVAPDGSSFTNYNCCQGASGIAIDQGNNVWVANFYGDSVSLISNAGVIIGSASYTGNGGLSRPQGIALDGAGNVWVANYRQTYLTELAGSSATVVGASLTPKTGYGADAGLLEAYALAIDASGNIWVSNQGNDSITKFVGLASPVKTPLSALPVAP